MLCPYCGVENREGAIFCLECGRSISTGGQPPVQPGPSERIPEPIAHDEVGEGRFDHIPARPSQDAGERSEGGPEPEIIIPSRPPSEIPSYLEGNIERFSEAQSRTEPLPEIIPASPAQGDRANGFTHSLPVDHLLRGAGTKGEAWIPLRTPETGGPVSPSTVPGHGPAEALNPPAGMPVPGWGAPGPGPVRAARVKVAGGTLDWGRIRFFLGGAVAILCALFILMATFAPWDSSTYASGTTSGWDWVGELLELDENPFFNMNIYNRPFFTGLVTLIVAILILVMGALLLVLARKGLAVANLVLFFMTLGIAVTNVVSLSTLGVGGYGPGEGLIIMIVFSVLGMAGSIVSLTGETRGKAKLNAGWPASKPPLRPYERG